MDSSQPPPPVNSQRFDVNSFTRFILDSQNSVNYPFTSQPIFENSQPPQSLQSSQSRSHCDSQIVQPTLKKKKISERNRNWSTEEDEILCKAWLLTIEDSVVGADQSRESMWGRTRERFIQLLGRESTRIDTALHNRWSLIQSNINKFSGFMRMIERAPTSGFNHEDNIGAAKEMYFDSEGHEFKWYGCWQILKDTAKWFQHTQLVEQRKKKLIQKTRDERVLEVEDLTEPVSPFSRNMDTSVTPLIATGDHDIIDGAERSDSSGTLSVGTSELPRPPGRKAAKNARRMKTVDNSEVFNLFVAEFSKLQNVEKEIAENQNIMALRREQMRIEAKREEEQKKLEAKRDEEKRKFEKEMMMTDPTTMATEEGKDWVIAHQKAIMARINAKGVEH